MGRWRALPPQCYFCHKVYFAEKLQTLQSKNLMQKYLWFILPIGYFFIVVVVGTEENIWIRRKRGAR